MSEYIGSYEIRGELGRGAMAVVWRAFDTKLEREVAVKEPCIPQGTNAATVEELGARFVREGRAAAALNHPGIVTIYAADIYDGRPAIVMELIEGETLADILDRGPLEPATAIAITDQLLDAVGYAHARGIVHRDIKPDNVFITHDGRIKLADFGIAHVGTTATLTQAGTVMGTPGYMSPEQVTGQPVDGRADLFSIGVVIYEMLTGSNPFGSTEGDASTTVMYRIVHEMPDDATTVVNVPPELSGTVMRAMAKDPNQRFTSAEEMQASLRGESVPAAPTASGVTVAAAARLPTSTQIQDASKKKTWLPYAIVGGVGAAIIGVLLLTSGSGTAGGPVMAESTTAEVAAADSATPVSVSLTAPGDGSTYDVGDSITIRADAEGTGDCVVTFYASGSEIDQKTGTACSTTYVANNPGSVSISVSVEDDAGETASSETVVVTFDEPSGGMSDPESAVLSYYETCNSGDAAAAYAFFSATRKAKYPYGNYVNKVFAFYGHGDVTVRDVDAGGSRATVYIDAYITPKGKSSSQFWTGSIELVKESGKWLIDKMNLYEG